MKTCPKCTFENAGARRRRCEVCGSRLDPPGPAGDENGKRQRSSSSSQLSVPAGHSADLTPTDPRRDVPSHNAHVAAEALPPLAAEPAAPTPAPPSIDSLFTTARGGVIRVSRQALSAAQEKFKLQFDLDVTTESHVLPVQPLQQSAERLGHHSDRESEAPQTAATRRPTPTADEPRAQLTAVGTGDSTTVPPALSLHTPARQANQPPVGTSISSAKQPGSALSSRGSLGGFRTPRSLLGESVVRLPFRPPVVTSATSTGDGEGSRLGFQAPRGASGTSVSAPVPASTPSSRGIAVHAESCSLVGTAACMMKPLGCDLLGRCEVRLPLQKDVPSPTSVVMGEFEFSTACVCPTLSSAMNLESSAATSASRVKPRHFAAALRSMGAAASGVKEDWVGHMLRVVLWKLACHDAQCGEEDLDGERILSPVHTLAQLAYRYNREYVDGHRSVLRRIAEKDSSPTVLMVLCVSRVMAERAGPHQLIVEVTDGWYFVRAQLDLPLSQLVRDGILNSGQKIVVWGASSSVEHATSVLELDGSSSTLLALSLNAVKPAASSAALGALPSYCVLKTPLSAIHANGGVVPCISGIVTRSLPPYYVEKTFLESGSDGDHSSAGKPTNRIVRNQLAEAKHGEEWEAKKYAAYERALAASNGDADVVTAMMRDKFSRHVTCCKTLVLEADDVAVAVQVNLSNGMEIDDTLPMEGDHVRLFSLYPAKASSMLPALNLQLLYSRGALQYAVDKAPGAAASSKNGPPSEPGTASLKFSRKVLTSFDQLASCKQGQLVDFLAVAVGICDADDDSAKKGFNCVWVGCTTRVNVFVVVEVHSAVGARELMIPILSTGVPCYIQNATFASLDESSEYTCVRLFATEFTAFVTKSIVPAVQKQIDALGTAASRWRDTLELGLKLLHDSEHHARCFLPQWKRQEAGLVATPFLSAGNVAGLSAPVSGPYYLTRSQHTPLARIGVQLHAAATSSREAPSTAKSLARPLFGKSPDKVLTAIREESGSDHRNRRSAVAIGSDDRGCAASSSEPGVRWPLHLFGNFDCSSKAALVVVAPPRGGGGADHHTLMVVDARSGVAAGTLNSFSDGCRPTGSCATSEESKSGHDVLLQVSFRTHLSTVVDVLVGLEHLSVLGASSACQPQQLSALCAEEDQYALAAARSQTLASGGDNVVKHWRMLLLHSVVIQDDLVALANHSHHRSDDDSPEPQESASTYPDWQTQCASMQRWNAAIVPNAKDALWWSRHEWARLWEHLQNTFDGKLFKLTLAKENRVTRLLLLKEACLIDDLMSS